MNHQDPQSQLLKELDALRLRVTELETKQAPSPARSLRRRSLLGFSLAGLFAVGVGTAFAATGACPNGYPFCFASNTPATAAEVNHNFAQIKEWVETKTGSVSSAQVTTSKLNTADIALNGGKMTGTNSAGNFHIDSANSGLYLNWFSGSGGVVIGDGSQNQIARFDTIGNLAIRLVNGRQPAYTVTKACGSANCTADCGTGVVKMAWGFHGANVTNNIGGDYVCGSARQWLGSCIGNTSCTVTTGCGSSSLFLECW